MSRTGPDPGRYGATHRRDDACAVHRSARNHCPGPALSNILSLPKLGFHVSQQVWAICRTIRLESPKLLVATVDVPPSPQHIGVASAVACCGSALPAAAAFPAARCEYYSEEQCHCSRDDGLHPSRKCLRSYRRHAAFVKLFWPEAQLDSGPRNEVSFIIDRNNQLGRGVCMLRMLQH